MITDEHIESYINSLAPDIPKELDNLEQWALDNKVPIIRRSMQSLLSFLIKTHKPKNILEIGTAIGFSALFMEHCSQEDCRITTIEKVEMRLVNARKNLAGHSRISLCEGDAEDILNKFSNDHTKRYDFIFLDAAKGQYLKYLEYIRKILIKGGMLVTDNVLLEGSIAESKFSIERRNRTIHMRMREYLNELTHCEDFDTVILPVGDGVAVSVYNKIEDTEHHFVTN
ncbi:MAG: O-methyltransferase [Lachnospiraceae bacterium]|nr:O-methyltransferase [Lachnospiraceae bacterium]